MKTPGLLPYMYIAKLLLVLLAPTGTISGIAYTRKKDLSPPINIPLIRSQYHSYHDAKGIVRHLAGHYNHL